MKEAVKEIFGSQKLGIAFSEILVQKRPPQVSIILLL